MKISTKGLYALRMMVDLAEQEPGSVISLKEISDRQNISKKYLEQIVPMLTVAGFLITNRGNRGGYSLARPADAYTVGDILRATEGGLAPISCLDCAENPCERCDTCETLYIWEGLQDVINQYVDGITLADVVERSRRKEKESV